jgi:hypothetical protein
MMLRAHKVPRMLWFTLCPHFAKGEFAFAFTKKGIDVRNAWPASKTLPYDVWQKLQSRVYLVRATAPRVILVHIGSWFHNRTLETWCEGLCNVCWIRDTKPLCFLWFGNIAYKSSVDRRRCVEGKETVLPHYTLVRWGKISARSQGLNFHSGGSDVSFLHPSWAQHGICR